MIRSLSLNPQNLVWITRVIAKIQKIYSSYVLSGINKSIINETRNNFIK